MANELSKRSVLRTLKDELHKCRYFYDGDGRNTYVVQAARDARDGDLCLVTKYEYDGVSTRISSSREYEGQWDGDWDSTETEPS